MTEQTQKIWEAFCGELIQEPTDDMKEALATTIRAVVEHCVPDDSEGHWVYIPQVLAIAKELESL
mgnify:CR=1 FL=1|jgi:hypothetical protein